MAVTDPIAPATAVAVSIRDLDVRYRVYEENRLGTRELVRRGFRGRKTTLIHAIKSVSLDVGVGEALGVVGANGSGKSTLLRTIAGLQPVHHGKVLVRGEPRLLGVNAALKTLVSGYRNIILGGLAMGLTPAEIDSRIDEVIEFSGLADAIDRPLNTYSSGMRSRLAFSIATLRTPEILLIDEALAVGDKAFRDKSLQRVREIQAEAATVIMVTHNHGEIRETCTRAIWLDDGRIRADGDVDEVLTNYEAST